MEFSTHPRFLRKKLSSVLKMVMAVAGAYMLYKAAGVIANTPTPAVVVLSGSMEPAFQRGDILFLWNRQQYVDIGDVVVYHVKNRPIPIVHRVVHDHHAHGKQFLLTKGDNNPRNDLDLYSYSQMYLDREADVTDGIVKAYLPWVGIFTILMNDYPWLKQLFLALTVLLT